MPAVSTEDEAGGTFFRPDEVDARFASALVRAAERAAPQTGDKNFLERRFEDALVQEFAVAFPDANVVARKKLPGVMLPDWDPSPGSIDVAALRGQELTVAAELKLDDVDQTLWDIYKMASASRIGSVSGAYVVAAAPEKTWWRPLDCVELFLLESSDEWYSEFLFDEYRKAWAHLLKGGTARPTRVPTQVRLGFLTAVRLRSYPRYELRALRVDDGSEDSWLEFKEGWPVPGPPDFPGEVPDAALTMNDLPAAGADADEFERFALTTNGYKRLGTFRRCANLGNATIARWRETGELPASLRDLRCALFFEQRRWRHFGEEFDEETLAYARALVEAMREIVTVP